MSACSTFYKSECLLAFLADFLLRGLGYAVYLGLLYGF